MTLFSSNDGRARGWPAEDLLGPLNDVERKFAPAVLYVAGAYQLLKRSPRVAIVGSRDASKEGLDQASALARALVGHEAVIVSGLARGIDTAAHTAAIDAGGRTIAVLGTPLTQFAVSANRDLQEEIMRDHLAISQFADGGATYKGAFPMRNRTMALICQASIIVEAGDGSGTLSQGWEALRLGRPLFIARRVADSGALAWPSEMLDYGARVLDDSLDELLEVLPPALESDIGERIR